MTSLASRRPRKESEESTAERVRPMQKRKKHFYCKYNMFLQNLWRKGVEGEGICQKIMHFTGIFSWNTSKPMDQFSIFFLLKIQNSFYGAASTYFLLIIISEIHLSPTSKLKKYFIGCVNPIFSKKLYYSLYISFIFYPVWICFFFSLVSLIFSGTLFHPITQEL